MTETIDRSHDISQALDRLSADERMKDASDYLRGTIAEGLLDRITGAVPSADDVKLMKFHGIYQQDDRDLRDERRRQKLEPAYQFMIRVRLPGGVCTPAQWLKLDELARACRVQLAIQASGQPVVLDGRIKRTNGRGTDPSGVLIGATSSRRVHEAAA